MNVHPSIHSPVVWLACFLGLPLMGQNALRAELVTREVKHGTVYGYKDTPLLPWAGGRYHVHDPDRPVPEYVVPGQPSIEGMLDTRPSDAIVLFNGSGLRQWEFGRPG